jgi:hypothetical protein
MISPWRRDLSPCSCKAHPIGTQTGEAEVLHLSADKAGSSPFWKLDRSEILACRDRRVWQKSLRRNKLKLLQRLIMLYRKVNAMHGSVSADRYLQEPNQELSSITAIIISLIVNSWDKRHLVRISQLKQKEKKNQEKNKLLYAFVRPTSKQWYRSGNMFPKCPPSQRKKSKQSWHADTRIPLRNSAAAARRSRKKS